MCVFCKIVSGELKTNILFENDFVVAFRDIHPLAPVHILVIPKEHIEGINFLGNTEKDIMLTGHMIIAAKELAKKEGIDKKGYKLLLRVGRDGGQEIEHVHLHLLGGARLSENIHPV